VDEDLNTSSESDELNLRLDFGTAALGFFSGLDSDINSSSSLNSTMGFFLAAVLLVGSDFGGSASDGKMFSDVPLFFLTGIFLAAGALLVAGSFLAAFFGDSFFFLGKNSSSDKDLKSV
jgi:hypothetical protein